MTARSYDTVLNSDKLASWNASMTQTLTYNSDGTVATISSTDGVETWAQALAYNSDGLLSSITTAKAPLAINGAAVTLAGLSWTAQNHSDTNVISPWSVAKTRNQDLLRFEFREGDEWSGDIGDVPAKERSELSSASVKNSYSRDYWASCSFKLTSPTWDLIRSIRAIIYQLHATTGSSQPVWKLEILPGGNLEIRTSYDTTVDFSSHQETVRYTGTANLFDDVYHHLVLHWKTTALTTGGVLEVWLDGAAILALPSVQMGYLNDSGGPYFKLGLYRQTHSDTIVHEVANLEYGTQNLTQRITAPLPLPASV